jgi:hypothetical protein
MKLRIALFCLTGGLCMSVASLDAGHLGWWYLSGVVLAGAYVPVARFGPRSWLGQFGAIVLLQVVVALLCTVWEAVIFIPGEKAAFGRNLISGVAMYLFFAAVLALLAKALKLREPSGAAAQRRPIGTAALMVALSGLAYVVYYLIFGAITYQFFTRQYYPEAQRMVAELGWWFWAIELARGILMTLAVLPVIYTLRMRRWQVAVAAGALLWIAGGAAPLLVPNSLMTAKQRYIHMVEILTQNACLGITAALLLTKPAAKGGRPAHG